MKKTTRLVAVLLSLIIVLSVWPMAERQLENNEGLLVDSNAGPSPIVREDISKREECVKHFDCADGSIITVLYAGPVHYRENGQWRDIDNSLVLSENILNGATRATYVPRSGALPVSIPQNLTDGQKITLSSNGFTVGFAPSAANQNISLQSAATVTAVDALASNLSARSDDISNPSNVAKTQQENIKENNDEIMALDNLSSAVVYTNVFQNTDLEYVVTATGIKEYLVVKTPQTEYIYYFNMDLGGLVPVAQEDGSILLFEPGNAEEAIFIIHAPYMYDSNGEFSDAVTMTLDNGKLTVEADAQWINDPGRAWPIFIDPTIIRNDMMNSRVLDTFVNAATLTTGTNYFNNMNLYAGTALLTALRRTYIKFDLSNLVPSDHVITAAEFKIKNWDSNAGYPILIYDAANHSFNPKTLTWNSQPQGLSKNADGLKNVASLPRITKSTGVEPTGQFYTLNGDSFIDVVEGWFQRVNPNNANGLIITTVDETVNGLAAFHSSSLANIITERPVLTIEHSLPELYVSSQSWKPIQPGDTTSINVTSNTSWVVNSSDTSWLTVSPSSGSKNKSFEITATVNDSNAERPGTVTVTTTNGAVTRAIHVLQSETTTTTTTTTQPTTITTTTTQPPLPTVLPTVTVHNFLEFSKAYLRKNSLIPSTHTYKAGSAGIVYHDDFHRDYVVSFDDKFTATNLKAPISISHNYNTPAYRFITKELEGIVPFDSAFGNNWLTNYNQFLCKLSVTAHSSKNVMAFFDSKGEMILFEYNISEDNWVGLGYNSYAYTLYKDGSAFFIQTIYGDTLSFDNSGRLEKITNSTLGNAATITITHVNNGFFEEIESIKDGSGKIFNFSYKKRRLEKIKYGNEERTYKYDDDGNLKELWYRSNSNSCNGPALIATYEYYDPSGPMKKLQDVDNRRIELEYDDVEKDKISKVTGFWDELNNPESYVVIHYSLMDPKKLIFGYSDGALEKRIFDENLDTGYNLIVDQQSDRLEIEERGRLVNIDQPWVRDLNDRNMQSTPPWGMSDKELLEPFFCCCEEDCAYGIYCPCECADAASCDCLQCGECECENCETPNCTCRCENNCGCVSCNAFYDFTTDGFGNLLVEWLDDGTRTLSKSNSYSSSGNYLASSTNEFGVSTYYDYDENAGFLTKKTDGEGNKVFYAYNAMRNLASVTQANLSNNYEYANDRISSITAGNGTSYAFTYDLWGRRAEAMVGGTVLTSNDFDTDGDNRWQSVTYANGQTVYCAYDGYGDITGISYDGGVTFAHEFEYDEGVIAKVTDHLSGFVTVYTVDSYWIHPLGDEGTVIYENLYANDRNFIETVNGYAFVYTFDSSLNAANGITTHHTAIDNIAEAEETTDWFGRRMSKTGIAGDTTVNSSFVYDDTMTTASTKLNSFVSEISNTAVSGNNSSRQYDYTYDGNGNITSISLDNQVLKSYAYDGAQQLVREDNADIDRTVTYSYDNHGNIVEKKIYAYSTWSTFSLNLFGSPLETISYAYEDTNWPDKLTSYGGTNIVSDDMGNPIAVDDGAEVKYYFWTAGRQLAHVLTDIQLISYTYDVLGMMTSKTVSEISFATPPDVDAELEKYDWSLELFDYSVTASATTCYAWTGDLRLASVMHEDGTTVRVLYDQAKEPFGYTIQDELSAIQTLLYEKNPQGDIISLIDPLDGSEIVGYIYDAWGNATIVEPVVYTNTITYNANGGSGSMASTSAASNEPAPLPSNTFTRATYYFGGWTAKRTSDNKYLYKSGSTENWYPQGQQPSGYVLKVFADQAMITALSPIDEDTITMYAQWTQASIVYTIVYNANGGSGSMANTSASYWAATPLRANTFTRADYKFEGWTAKRTSDNKYLYVSGSTEDWYPQNQQPSGYTLKIFADQETVTALSPEDSDIITMYAQWSLIPVYTIVFNANGGSGSMANTTAQYNVYSLLPANTFTRAGYLMAGWTAYRASDNKYLYKDGSAEGWYLQDQQPSGYALKVIDDQSEASTLSDVNGDTITLTAQWIDAGIAYLIVYDANGGYGTMPDTTAAFLNEVSLRPNKFTNAGYLMAGWAAHRASDDSYLYEDVLSETEDWYPEGQEPSGYDLRIFADQKTVSALSETSGDTITMRAQWEDDETFVPIDPCDLEEPLLRYSLKRSGLMLDEQGLDDLAGAILELDILSLDLLRDIYEGEGYDETETEDLIAELLADYSTEELFMFVYPLLAGEDLNQWLEPDNDLWPWIWFLEGLIGEITGCIFDVLGLDWNEEDDVNMALFAVEQVLMGYVYLIRADQNELQKLERLVSRTSSEEIDLLYAALDALLAGEVDSELDLFGEESILYGLDENDILEIFGALLPFVLTQEVPNLENLFALCDGWGFTQQETEDAVLLIVSVLAAEPLTAAMFLADDAMGGNYASRYGAGPVQNAGGCGDNSQLENAIILASAHFYPIAVAIREEAAGLLELDLQDESDAALGAIISAMFLYCYFADYQEHINIWLAANGEDPMDFGGVMLSQVGGMTQQLRDLLGEQMDNGGAGFFNKLSGFFSGLDIGRDAGYNKNSDSGPSRAGASILDISDPRAQLNPLTYRGYLYDPDVDMYYLQSRWYSSEWGRFLNADSIFDTGTGVLGTNMFLYCDNEPVNRVDPRGLWWTNVHDGTNSFGVVSRYNCSISKHNGTYYGTYTWTKNIGISNEKNIDAIIKGNKYIDDIFTRLKQGIKTEARTWHENRNLFVSMVLPDTRELNAYNTLIKLVNEEQFEEAKRLYEIYDGVESWRILTKLSAKDKADKQLENALFEIGVAAHPMQDKDGHIDFFASDDPFEDFFGSLIAGLKADMVFVTYNINGITYEHFDNMIQSRDETYNIIGRFYMEYGDIIRRR